MDITADQVRTAVVSLIAFILSVTVHEFGHDPILLAFAPDLVNANNIRMIQSAGGASFALKSQNVRRIAC